MKSAKEMLENIKEELENISKPIFSNGCDNMNSEKVFKILDKYINNLKTPQDFFEELNFKLTINDKDKIEYKDNVGEIIKFGKKTRLFWASRSINQNEYKAIQQQILELRLGR